MALDKELHLGGIVFVTPPQIERRTTTAWLVRRKGFTTRPTTREWTTLQYQIAATDAQIDRLDYGLYGPTQGEIKIVEGTI